VDAAFIPEEVENEGPSISPVELQERYETLSRSDSTTTNKRTKKERKKRAVIKEPLLPTPNQANLVPDYREQQGEKATCKKKKCEAYSGPCTCIADPGGSGGENKMKGRHFVPPCMQNPPCKITIKLPFITKDVPPTPAPPGDHANDITRTWRFKDG